MSFLRRDKSKSNIRNLNSTTAGQLSVQGSADFGENDRTERGTLEGLGLWGRGRHKSHLAPEKYLNEIQEDGSSGDEGAQARALSQSSEGSWEQQKKGPIQGDNPGDDKTFVFRKSVGQGNSALDSGTAAANDVGYSPRSSIVSMNSQGNSEGEGTDSGGKLKESYKGFHANRGPKGMSNVPPLSYPIKPKFKKSGSLLGKLIHPSRKDNDSSSVDIDINESSFADNSGAAGGTSGRSSNSSAVSPSPSYHVIKRPSLHGSSKMFRIPSISLDHHLGSSEPHTHHNDENKESNDSRKDNGTSDNELLNTAIPTTFQIDMDLNEMHGIVKSLDSGSPSSTRTESKDGYPLNPKKISFDSRSKKSGYTSAPQSYNNSKGDNTIVGRTGVWRAPDSWDVKLNHSDKTEPLNEIGSEEGESDGEPLQQDYKDREKDSKSPTPLTERDAHNQGRTSTGMNDNNNTEKRESEITKIPPLYGVRSISHNINKSKTKNLTKGPNNIVRIFKEDNTFTTILCPLETSTAELLSIVQRKFFLESTSNYHISVYIGNCVKVLESFERPLKIQMALLLLSGYTDKDNLRIIGREDLSSVCKFVVENIYLRGLTHEEEMVVSKNYVDVNISKLGLKNIPIKFHQHTYEIEKLNVGDNPSIHIPLDFIQSCTNLHTIIYSRNGCSRFPQNILEAKKLSFLDMEKNFLDGIPSRICHLKNLTHLKLNSNQLSTLPKSFSRLEKLVTLNLSSNYFHRYPEVINDLVNLEELDLSYNDLSYISDSLGKLTKLTILNLCTNKLSKNLPFSFANLVSLKKLDIRYNQLTNIDVLGTLPELEVVHATKNMISTFNDRMEKLRLLLFDRNPVINLSFENILPNLTILDLSKAKITEIPANFVERISNIEKLVLDKNHLVNLPIEIGSLKKLAYFSLYSNNLQVIPATIGKLSALQYLDLHSNNLQTLPNEIWDLRSLSFLNVSSNMLIAFPEPPVSVVKRVSNAAKFDSPFGYATDGLESNEVVETHGSVSEASSNESAELISESDLNTDNSSASHIMANQSSSLASSLLILTLADNRLNDDCFEPISFLAELKILNLSYNDIIEFPEGAARRMVKLTDLYLSGNQLSSLPADELENLKSLKLLYLNNNKLTSLPAELSKLKALQHLDVGSNLLKYNIANWPYDWNWCWNKNLKYLNFSGNKRFEIKESHVKNPETGEDFDSLLVLKHLKVLGLIDITLTTPSVPDYGIDVRIRTTASELDNIGYGVSDSMGMRDYISLRDVFIQKFRGNENEALICSFDGKRGTPNMGHRISYLCKNLFVPNFTRELNNLKDDEGIQDAMRRTFLSLNKEINGILSAKKNNNFNPSILNNPELAELDLATDTNAGCAITVIYIKDKKLYTANIGDIEAVLSRNNGDHVLLSRKDDPTSREEFERIRASGGCVTEDGALDGELTISRGVGFFNYLPHTHSGPHIKEIDLTTADDMIVVASKSLWDHVSYELAVDILRQEKSDPMIAAQKLRDYAICYGATDKIGVIVLTLGEKKSNKLRFGNNGLYNNLARQQEIFANKKRRDRLQPSAGDSSIRRLEEEIEPPEGELALVFTDIKNSTLLWDTYPVAMRSAIKIHNKVMRRQLRIVGGYEVKTEGDSFMVSFPSPTSALLWCLNVQQQLLKEDWPSEILEADQCFEVTDANGVIINRGLSVRMGIHWGSPVCELDYVTRRMDYFGPMVNRASRISTTADGGQISISSDFLMEMRSLMKIHQDIIAGKTTLKDAYQGNVRAGEIIEREIQSIEEIGVSYFELGEKKLKGLETPELITLIYPKKLELRFQMFKQNITQAEQHGSRRKFIATLPVDSVYDLRAISLRLETICSTLNGTAFSHEGFRTQTSTILNNQSDNLFHDSDFISLFNHVVTRIENCVGTFYLRQQLSFLNGKNGLINFKDAKPLMEELDFLKDQLKLSNLDK